jgi:glycosyltransferase involved in cell wall biosynthesis
VNSSKAGILGALAARAAGVPRVIFTAHGWAFNEARPEWQKIILKGIYALLISLADATICVSDAVRRDMAWVPGARKKLKVVRLGVSPTEFKSRDVSREALLPGNPDGIWIGMLAELHPTKRIEDAIEALALLVPAHPELKLIVLGEGEHRATLEALIRERSLEGHAFLRGFVADGSTYLKAFDAFAFPSRTEALGYAALEAGQAGLPVAASNVGGIPEIIDDRKSGLLVPALAPALLAAALEELITNPDEAHRFGEALRERVYTAFSVEGMVSSTRAAYSFP